MQGEINIAIGDDPPATYFGTLWRQCGNGEVRYGGIIDSDVLRENLATHCIPEGMDEAGKVGDYTEFLQRRRLLMAGKIRDYYRSLQRDASPGVAHHRSLEQDWVCQRREPERKAG